MGRSKKYKVIAIVLVVAMFLQISPFGYSHSVLAGYEPELADIDLSLLDQLMRLGHETGPTNTPPNSSPRAADCFALYLPLILRSSNGKSISSGAMCTKCSRRAFG